MNFLGKLTGKSDNGDSQATNSADAQREAALAAARQVLFNPQWSTRAGQCDPPASCEHWAFSFFCVPCAAATAKSRQDGANVCFNILCWQPIGTSAWIRKGYRVNGTCGDDLMCGIFCMPCLVRRAYTEVEVRKNVPLLRGGPDEWQTTLFGCGCCEFFQAVLCPFCPAATAKQLMQPDREVDVCFDWMCTVPFGMYGQVRHMYGIQAEFGLCEDLCLPLVCYPCAVAQAAREAQIRLTKFPQVYGMTAASGAGAAIMNKFLK